MTKLTVNSTPAERRRGCVFAEKFESQALVEKNGGTVNGSPTIDFGSYFNGTTDYIDYKLNKGLSPAFSISCWINTSLSYGFANVGICTLFKGWDYYVFFEIKPDGNFKILFNNGSGNDNITLTAGVGANTWTHIALTYDGTDFRSYVDGTLTDTDTGVAFIDTNVDARIASDQARRDFEGTIKDLNIFNVALTEKEISDFANNSTYNYRNEAVLDLPMTMETHDPTNADTLDVSGNGNNATFGDGSTPNTYPTKLVERGYSYNGTTTDMTIGDVSDLNFAPTDSFSISVLFKPASVAERGYLFTKMNTSAGYGLYFRDGAIRFANNGSVGSSSDTVFDETIQVATMVFSPTAGVDVTFYRNGEEAGTLSAQTFTQPTGVNAKVGNRNGTSPSTATYFEGDIYQVIVNDFVLTPLQVADLHIDMMSKINKV